MTNYKEVLQLAQGKGYLYSDYFLNENGYRSPEWESIEVQLMELSLMQKWLRDKHNLHIIIKPYHEVFEFTLWTTGKISLSNAPVIDGFLDTYEQALLEGINEALKLI